MLALFGIGILGQKVLNQCIKQNINIDYLIDNNIIECGEKYILKPQKIEESKRKETTVIITTFKQELKIDEIDKIKNELIQLGYKKVLNLQEGIIEYKISLNYFYLGDTIFSLSSINEIRKILSDELSINILESNLEFRNTGNIDLLHKYLSLNDQYLPNFFVNHLNSLNKKVNIIDCGACFGDLLQKINVMNIQVNNYFAFEPDTQNITIMRENIILSNINSVILPFGVGNKEEEVKFDSGQGMSCSVNENGNSKIKIVSICDYIFCSIDFIKMDIEGFEKNALEGVLNIIKVYKPALAISLYHKPNDILELPLFLKDYYNNFYIRQHGRYGFEMVLYCY